MEHLRCSLLLHTAGHARPSPELDDCRVPLSFATEDVWQSLLRLRAAGVELRTAEPSPPRSESGWRFATRLAT